MFSLHRLKIFTLSFSLFINSAFVLNNELKASGFSRSLSSLGQKTQSRISSLVELSRSQSIGLEDLKRLEEVTKNELNVLPNGEEKKRFETQVLGSLGNIIENIKKYEDCGGFGDLQDIAASNLFNSGQNCERERLEQSSLNNLLNFLREFENKVSPKKKLTDSEMSSLKELLYKKHKNAVSDSINILEGKYLSSEGGMENVAAITDSIKYSLIKRNNAIRDRRNVDTELGIYRDDKNYFGQFESTSNLIDRDQEADFSFSIGIKSEDQSNNIFGIKPSFKRDQNSEEINTRTNELVQRFLVSKFSQYKGKSIEIISPKSTQVLTSQELLKSNEKLQPSLLQYTVEKSPRKLKQIENELLTNIYLEKGKDINEEEDKVQIYLPSLLKKAAASYKAIDQKYFSKPIRNYQSKSRKLYEDIKGYEGFLKSGDRAILLKQQRLQNDGSSFLALPNPRVREISNQEIVNLIESQIKLGKDHLRSIEEDYNDMSDSEFISKLLKQNPQLLASIIGEKNIAPLLCGLGIDQQELYESERLSQAVVSGLIFLAGVVAFATGVGAPAGSALALMATAIGTGLTAYGVGAYFSDKYKNEDEIDLLTDRFALFSSPEEYAKMKIKVRRLKKEIDSSLKWMVLDLALLPIEVKALKDAVTKLPDFYAMKKLANTLKNNKDLLSISQLSRQGTNKSRAALNKIISENLTPNELRRLERAEKILGRKLSDNEKAKVFIAHLVGSGEMGKDGSNLAKIGNYTKKQISKKARILSKFSKNERRLLMENGIVGLGKDAPLLRIGKSYEFPTVNGKVYSGSYVKESTDAVYFVGSKGKSFVIPKNKLKLQDISEVELPKNNLKLTGDEVTDSFRQAFNENKFEADNMYISFINEGIRIPAKIIDSEEGVSLTIKARKLNGEEEIIILAGDNLKTVRKSSTSRDVFKPRIETQPKKIKASAKAFNFLIENDLVKNSGGDKIGSRYDFDEIRNWTRIRKYEVHGQRKNLEKLSWVRSRVKVKAGRGELGTVPNETFIYTGFKEGEVVSVIFTKPPELLKGPLESKYFIPKNFAID